MKIGDLEVFESVDGFAFYVATTTVEGVDERGDHVLFGALVL